MALLVCRCPIMTHCRSRSASSGALWRISWVLFSPKRRRPSAAACRIASTGKVLLTGSSATLSGGRAPRSQAALMRAWMAASRCGIESTSVMRYLSYAPRRCAAMSPIAPIV
ncbi:Uncharacterised protein [Bordetella pertussis]|nr:Uncharacterised protein [Bordetella pertussis]